MILEAKRKAAGEELKAPGQQTTEPETTEPEAIEPEVKSKHNIFSKKIKNEDKNINEQIFRYYFLYQTSSYLTKD